MSWHIFSVRLMPERITSARLGVGSGVGSGVGDGVGSADGDGT